MRLGNPARWRPSGTFVGDRFVAVAPVHPDVTELVLTIDWTEQRVTVHQVDGVGYAVFEVPQTVTAYSGELLIGAGVVPGSTQQVETPEPRD